MKVIVKIGEKEKKLFKIAIPQIFRNSIKIEENFEKEICENVNAD
jgi:hypothetical protein